MGVNERVFNDSAEREIQGLTSCLRCDQVIGTDNALLLGADPGMSIAQRRTAAMLGGMQNHLEKKHAKLNARLEVSALGYLGLLRLMQFRTSDPAIQFERDRGRWNLLQQVIPCRMPDDKIASKSLEFARELVGLVEDDIDQAVGLSLAWAPSRVVTVSKVAEKIRELMTGYRDAVEEPNKYPPEPPAQEQATRG